MLFSRAALRGLAVLGAGTMAVSLLSAAQAGAVTVSDLTDGPFPAVTTSSAPTLGVVSANALANRLDDRSDAATRARLRSRPWAYPVLVGTPISGVFGETGTYWPGGHAGIDFDGEVGDPIFAAINGRVIYAQFNSGGYGNLVITRRKDGTEVRYAHLSRILVDEGDQLRAGERLGRMGATGQATGAHLHLEVRVNDGQTPSNPAALWSGKRRGIPAKAPQWSCAKYGGCS